MSGRRVIDLSSYFGADEVLRMLEICDRDGCSVEAFIAATAILRLEADERSRKSEPA
jgi:hypothetical protein